MPGRILSCVLAILSVLTSLTAAAEPEPVRFASRGKLVGQWSLADLMEKVTATRITVWEPHEDKNVSYEGFGANRLLDAIYGEAWKQAEEVLFTCADGYQPSLPVDRFKHHDGFLVYRRLDQSAFRVDNRYQAEKDVPLGPLYLVWDNLKSRELRAGGAAAWPYQVTGIDLVDFEDRFPGMSPPHDASKEATRGFLAFRENCMACHTINGDGGGKAPELNYPTSVTEYLSDAWIRKWMMDPRSIRYNSTMPTFASHPRPDALMGDVLAYLRTMANHKRSPEERAAR